MISDAKIEDSEAFRAIAKYYERRVKAAEKLEADQAAAQNASAPSCDQSKALKTHKHEDDHNWGGWPPSTNIC